MSILQTCPPPSTVGQQSGGSAAAVDDPAKKCTGARSCTNYYKGKTVVVPSSQPFLLWRFLVLPDTRTRLVVRFTLHHMFIVGSSSLGYFYTIVFLIELNHLNLRNTPVPDHPVPRYSSVHHESPGQF